MGGLDCSDALCQTFGTIANPVAFRLKTPVSPRFPAHFVQWVLIVFMALRREFLHYRVASAGGALISRRIASFSSM